MISIIVPIYNTEKYLSKCLDSLINQTYKDIEIICINDGSLDRSINVLKQYQLIDSRIIVIDKKNAGVSSARNEGLKIATGDYIMFVDADDYLDTDACRLLLECATEKSLEILSYNFIKFDLSKNSYSVAKLNDVLICDKPFKFKDNFENILKASLNSVKLYKSSIIKDNKLFFNEKIHMGEDMLFYIEASLLANNIYYLNLPLYYYRQSSNGATTNSTAILEIIKSYKVLENFIAKHLPTKKYLIKEILSYKTFDVLQYYYSKQTGNVNKLKQLVTMIKYALKNRLFKQNIIWFWAKIKPFILKIVTGSTIIGKTKNYFINSKHAKIVNNVKKYQQHNLVKLQKKANNGAKIKLLFIVDRISNFSQADFYKKLSDNNLFETELVLYPFYDISVGLDTKKYYEEFDLYLSNLDIKYKKGFDEETKEFIPLETFTADIIVYTSPWTLPESFKPSNKTNYKKYLFIYLPYCFHMLDIVVNYIEGFHTFLWKYFVESKLYEKNYLEKYSATNVVGLGNLKLDNYKKLENKTSYSHGKKTIIYAPHWTIPRKGNKLNVSTFDTTGNELLQFAKQNKDKYHFIFKPHPNLFNQLILSGAKTYSEVTNYFNEWSTIAETNTDNNYYYLFKNSDMMISDSISFLAEFLPSENPFIHLVPEDYKEKFSVLGKEVISGYYVASTFEMTTFLIDQVLEKENDFLKDKRLDALKSLEIDNTLISDKIVAYLEKEFRKG